MNPIRSNWSQLLRHARRLGPIVRRLQSRAAPHPRPRPGRSRSPNVSSVRLLTIRLRMPRPRLRAWSRHGRLQQLRPAAWWLVLLGGMAFVVVVLMGLASRPSSSPSPAHVSQPPVSGSAATQLSPGPHSPGTPASGGQAAAEALVPAAGAPNPEVSVWISKTGRIERMPLEQYVRGVVAAEMPSEFELAALQAQAIAARTYAVKRLADMASAGVKPSSAPGGALVSDTVSDQAYLQEKAVASKWTGELADKLQRAVESTAGLILAYEDAPIFPAFFSTSGGTTENSENYWGQKLPYLRSVASPWEKDISPRAETVVTMKMGEVARKLGLSADVPASGTGAPQLLDRTEGGQVKSVRIGGRSFTGRDVREKLGLLSANFTWKIEDGQMIFTVLGYGHGVGMSQWGAQGMALQGRSAKQILQHYYTDVEIAPLSDAHLRPIS